MNVGRAIKAARERLGMSKVDLAAALDVGIATVYEWEDGDYNPRIDKLPAIAKVLKCDVEDLVA